MSISAGSMSITPLALRAGLLRATPYPPPSQFTSAYGYGDYLKSVAALRLRGGAPLAMQLHLPPAPLLAQQRRCVEREIALQGRLFAGMDTLDRLSVHGAGSLGVCHLAELMATLRRWFSLMDDDIGDYAIDAGAGACSPQHLSDLRALGFNRVVLQGVVPGAVAAARQAGLRCIGIDIDYGQPGQTVMALARTLAEAALAAPDRIALRPWTGSGGADPVTALDMLGLCIRRLGAAGYLYIGMDHFARPGDALALAQRQGRLHRHADGYSSHAASDCIGIGPGALSTTGASCSENTSDIAAWCAALEGEVLPIARGMRLTMDQLLRRAISDRLMCNFELSVAAIEQAFPVNFAEYFAPELRRLDALARAGWLTIDGEWISVNPARRPQIRTVCALFEH
ncbi:MAG: coproporphyrinogen III oxidase [Pseudomonadota bacterium]